MFNEVKNALESLLFDEYDRKLASNDFEAFSEKYQLTENQKLFFRENLVSKTKASLSNVINIENYQSSFPLTSEVVEDLNTARDSARLANPDYYVRPVTVVTTTTTINTLITTTTTTTNQNIDERNLSKEDRVEAVKKVSKRILDTLDFDKRNLLISKLAYTLSS